MLSDVALFSLLVSSISALNFRELWFYLRMRAFHPFPLHLLHPSVISASLARVARRRLTFMSVFVQ